MNIDDPFVSNHAVAYAAAMAEARAEYVIWEASMNFPDTVIQSDHPELHKCKCGTALSRPGRCVPCRIIDRAIRFPACACGNPYFVAGKCKSCYYRDYNAARTQLAAKAATTQREQT